jgi:hypothetical protein
MLNEAQVLLLFLTQQGLNFIHTALSPNTESKCSFKVTIIMSTPPVELQSVYQQMSLGYDMNCSTLAYCKLCTHIMTNVT